VEAEQYKTNKQRLEFGIRLSMQGYTGQGLTAGMGEDKLASISD